MIQSLLMGKASLMGRPEINGQPVMGYAGFLASMAQARNNAPIEWSFTPTKLDKVGIALPLIGKFPIDIEDDDENQKMWVSYSRPVKVFKFKDSNQQISRLICLQSIMQAAIQVMSGHNSDMVWAASMILAVDAGYTGQIHRPPVMVVHMIEDHLKMSRLFLQAHKVLYRHKLIGKPKGYLIKDYQK